MMECVTKRSSFRAYLKHPEHIKYVTELKLCYVSP